MEGPTMDTQELDSHQPNCSCEPCIKKFGPTPFKDLLYHGEGLSGPEHENCIAWSEIGEEPYALDDACRACLRALGRWSSKVIVDPERKVKDVLPEELARIIEDCQTYQEGEGPNIYGWRATNRFDRADYIEAAALMLRTLLGDECVPTRQMGPSIDAFNTASLCRDCAGSDPCKLHKDQPGSNLG